MPSLADWPRDPDARASAEHEASRLWLDASLAAPAAVTPQPTARHASLLRGLLRPVGTAGNLTTDAHLAALAIEHGADIVSYDRDFARFPGVRHRLPG